MTRTELLEDVRSWEGVRFRHQGRTKSGVDCIGIFVCLLRDRNELPTDFQQAAVYGRAPNTSEFIDTIRRYCTPIDKVEDACLVAFKWPGAKYPSHAGVIDGGNMIHAYERVGRVVRHGYREPWLRLTDSIWRLPGVL
jgi:cell wall-associated NlpC family hydrolase